MTEEISKIQNKMINSLLIEKYVILKSSYSKIYTANQYERKWVYSNLKGNLILCIEKSIKIPKFLLMDLNTFEITFECEIFKNFVEFFKRIKKNFFSLEINNGFIGFEFEKENDGNNFKTLIMNLSQESVINEQLNNKNVDIIYNLGKNNQKILQKKFENENFSNEININNNLIEINFNDINKSIETLEIKNNDLILKGNGFEGIDKYLKRLKHIKFIYENKNYIGDSKIFSRYIADNILKSYNNKLIFEKHNINKEIIITSNSLLETYNLINKNNNQPIPKTNNNQNKNIPIPVPPALNAPQVVPNPKSGNIPIPPPIINPIPSSNSIPKPPPVNIVPINNNINNNSNPENNEQTDLEKELNKIKNKGLKKVETKEYVSPALKKPGEENINNSGGNDMKSQLMNIFKKRNEQTKINETNNNLIINQNNNVNNKINNNELSKNNNQINNVQKTIVKNEIQNNNNQTKINNVNMNNNKTITNQQPVQTTIPVPVINVPSISKGKGSIPVPPPLNIVPPANFNNTSSNQSKSTNNNNNKPLDLQSELNNIKKGGLKKVETKEYISPSLKKQNDNNNSVSSSNVGNDQNDMRSQLFNIFKSREQNKPIINNINKSNNDNSSNSNNSNNNNSSQFPFNIKLKKINDK